MSDSIFYLGLRVDCEATAHAINDAALGERAVRALADIAQTEAIGLTLYVIPTDLEASGAMYRDLAAAGVEVGLHIHPADQGWAEFLGIYDAETQRTIISQAVERFEAVMGFAPRCLCPGYHSANDATFGVLCELGFTHGNVSCPTRVLPECAAVWAGAPLEPYYAHPANRVLAGYLDFVEVTMIVDPDSRMWGGKHPQDLRVELVDAKNHWYTTAKAVERQLATDQCVKYIQMTTHNIFDFDKPDDFRRQTLEKMIAQAKTIVTDRTCRWQSGTVGDIAAAFRKVVDIDEQKQQAAKVTLDTRGRA